ncbi:MAG: hypothetical protein ACRD72_19315 [Candidatus Angelobacter sp.]
MIDWIQDGLLAVSAVLVWRYVKATQRLVKIGQDQAAQTTLLAEAAQRQTEATERHVAILQAQIKNEAASAAATLKTCLEELGQTATRWGERMTTWGNLMPQIGLDLFPDGWAVALEHARKTLPDLHRELLAIQQSTKEVSWKLGQFSARASNYRHDTEAKEIKDLYLQIRNKCDAALLKLPPA